MVEPGAGSDVVVGVAAMAIGRAGQGQLITYALGSCIGLTAYDPIARVGGLLHFMLPEPAEQAEPRQHQPFVYATTGMPRLLRELHEAGAQQDRLIVCAAGGAELMAGAASMAIGARNRRMLRTILGQAGIALAAEVTGGRVARTLTLDLANGQVRVRSRDVQTLLWVPGGTALVRHTIES